VLQQVINSKKMPSLPFLIVLNNNLMTPLKIFCGLRLDAIEAAKFFFSSRKQNEFDVVYQAIGCGSDPSITVVGKDHNV
jgi:hypothetical protein